MAARTIYWNLDSNQVQKTATALGPLADWSAKRGSAALRLVLLAGGAPVLLANTTVIGIALRDPAALKGDYLAGPLVFTRGATAADGYTGTLATDTAPMRGATHANPADPLPESGTFPTEASFYFIDSGAAPVESLTFPWAVIAPDYRPGDPPAAAAVTYPEAGSIAVRASDSEAAAGVSTAHAPSVAQMAAFAGNASNIMRGTLSADRLPSSVPRKNADNVWLANNDFPNTTLSAGQTGNNGRVFQVTGDPYIYLFDSNGAQILSTEETSLDLGPKSAGDLPWSVRWAPGLWLQDNPNTLARALMPAPGQSVRLNGAGTTFEAFYPLNGTPINVTNAARLAGGYSPGSVVRVTDQGGRIELCLTNVAGANTWAILKNSFQLYAQVYGGNLAASINGVSVSQASPTYVGWVLESEPLTVTGTGGYAGYGSRVLVDRVNLGSTDTQLGFSVSSLSYSYYNSGYGLDILEFYSWFKFPPRGSVFLTIR